MLQRDCACERNVGLIHRRLSPVKPVLYMFRCNKDSRLIPLAERERGRSLYRNRRIQRTAPLPWVHSGTRIPVVVRNLVLRAERLGGAASQSIETQEAVFHTRIGSRGGQPFESQFVEAEEATRQEYRSVPHDLAGDSYD